MTYCNHLQLFDYHLVGCLASNMHLQKIVFKLDKISLDNLITSQYLVLMSKSDFWFDYLLMIFKLRELFHNKFLRWFPVISLKWTYMKNIMYEPASRKP